jgi:hypothetical protein
VASCLLAAGGIKSVERTIALRFASSSMVTQAAMPIYEFMRLEPWLRSADAISSTSSEDNGSNGESPLPSSPPLPPPSEEAPAAEASTASIITASTTISTQCTYDYILMGERQWYLKYKLLRSDGDNGVSDKACAADAACGTPEFVTLHEIRRSRELALCSGPRVVLLCVAFSLFKLCRRRLSRLYMYEWRQLEKTPRFYYVSAASNSSGGGGDGDGDCTGPFSSVDDLLFALHVELRFLFDSLYTKASGTAFTRLGLVFCVTTTFLLVVSAALLMRSATVELDKQAEVVKEAPIVTQLLLVAALVIESYQLAQIVLSDWTKVWLACTYVRLTREMGTGQWPNSFGGRMI